jgi:hypothetical protein
MSNLETDAATKSSAAQKRLLTPQEKAARQARLKAEEQAEKAELMQSIKALYIPFSLFIATCIFAAGAFMVYYDEPAGYGFIAVTAVIAVSAFICLFKFQNPYRAKGIVPTRDTIMETSSKVGSPDFGTVKLTDKNLPSDRPDMVESEAEIQGHVKAEAQAMAKARAEGRVVAVKTSALIEPEVTAIGK